MQAAAATTSSSYGQTVYAPCPAQLEGSSNGRGWPSRPLSSRRLGTADLLRPRAVLRRASAAPNSPALGTSPLCLGYSASPCGHVYSRHSASPRPDFTQSGRPVAFAVTAGRDRHAGAPASLPALYSNSYPTSPGALAQSAARLRVVVRAAATPVPPAKQTTRPPPPQYVEYFSPKDIEAGLAVGSPRSLPRAPATVLRRLARARI